MPYGRPVKGLPGLALSLGRFPVEGAKVPQGIHGPPQGRQEPRDVLLGIVHAEGDHQRSLGIGELQSRGEEDVGGTARAGRKGGSRGSCDGGVEPLR